MAGIFRIPSAPKDPIGGRLKLRFIVTALFGLVAGFYIGISFPGNPKFSISNLGLKSKDSSNGQHRTIYVPTNPRGAETLPPGIVRAETDLYLRRLSGDPEQDLMPSWKAKKYLVVFAVGIRQKDNVNKCVSKFSENFTIVLFHYDGKASDWDSEFEWSRQAIHVSVRKQTKWWFAKRFLHPAVVVPYEYIFLWDEDLGVDHFDAEEYIKIVRKHGLEISQPALDPSSQGRISWDISRKKAGMEVHRGIDKANWSCSHGGPPCEAFVEIMAPVFSRKAWRCVWYLVQNDLVHGWGLDFALRRCAEEQNKIGVVDAQWLVHKGVPTLMNEAPTSSNGFLHWQAVQNRCFVEWREFNMRFEAAEKQYKQYQLGGVGGNP